MVSPTNRSAYFVIGGGICRAAPLEHPGKPDWMHDPDPVDFAGGRDRDCRLRVERF